MRISYREAASDDLVRQFRYYLVTVDAAEVAIRFLEAAKRTAQALQAHPSIGVRLFLDNPRLHNFRSWPVTGFDAIRIYYMVLEDCIHVVRILHSKRDVRRILEIESPRR